MAGVLSGHSIVCVPSGVPGDWVEPPLDTVPIDPSSGEHNVRYHGPL